MIFARLRNKDHMGAALLILLGSAVAFVAPSYHVGALTSMGAGYIPLVLGALMIIVGLLIGVTANPRLNPKGPAAGLGHASAGFEMRAWMFILGGIAAFVLFGTYGGLVPATFACVFISALGDRQNSLRDAFKLACLMVVASYAIFSLGLKLQMAPFSWG